MPIFRISHYGEGAMNVKVAILEIVSNELADEKTLFPHTICAVTSVLKYKLLTITLGMVSDLSRLVDNPAYSVTNNINLTFRSVVNIKISPEPFLLHYSASFVIDLPHAQESHSLE
uniref:Uncharacterized protein n=1 Tax=Glossina austeni TaxID=7395 RepID=A0A1A9UIM1_GLOAU